MSNTQIIMGALVLVVLAMIWAFGFRGSTSHAKFSDIDNDGEPDESQHEKEAARLAFAAEQERRHGAD